MEAATSVEPRPGYLSTVIETCHANGALFVLDEMITGFRWNLGGAQAQYAIEPDLSTFGKGIANGFSLSALTGRREIMELGGLQTDHDRVFLLSTTHGGETTGLAAGLATLAVYKDEDVISHLAATGRALQDGITEVARSFGIEDYFRFSATPRTSSTPRATRTASHRRPSGHSSCRRRSDAVCSCLRSSSTTRMELAT